MCELLVVFDVELFLIIGFVVDVGFGWFDVDIVLVEIM